MKELYAGDACVSINNLCRISLNILFYYESLYIVGGCNKRKV
jgi:hypothetical protein